MGFTLNEVVPWGRSFDEYVAMFGLTGVDFQSRILSCGDGPAAFNADATRRGGHVTSLDPIYAFTADQIRERIAATYPAVMDQLRKNMDSYVWTTFRDAEAVGRMRMAAMETFLTDYDTGRHKGRYVAGALPSLPFPAGRFDLALSSHFLFLYSAHLTAEFHLRSLLEMMRVAGQARIFPLLTLGGRPSPHLAPVRAGLERAGLRVATQRVPYEFQRGGNEMMVIQSA